MERLDFILKVKDKHSLIHKLLPEGLPHTTGLRQTQGQDLLLEESGQKQTKGKYTHLRKKIKQWCDAVRRTEDGERVFSNEETFGRRPEE